MTASTKGQHKATYATDKKKGGYLIRVVGPHAEKFATRIVPVTTKAGAVHDEDLIKLIASGPDQDTGTTWALYTFKAKPRDEPEVVF